MDELTDAIKYFGECTAYSAKGHFKSADFRRILIYVLVIINILFSVLAIIDIFPAIILKSIGGISIIASILVLIYQTKEEADFISNSMKAGEEYLKLHNDIFVIYKKGKINEEIVEEIKDKINKLNGKKKPSISFIARHWAKHSIEKSNEMNIWWK